MYFQLCFSRPTRLGHFFKELLIATAPQPNSAWTAICNIGGKTRRKSKGFGMDQFLV